MVSAPDSLVSEMIIITAVSCHHQQLWTAVSLFCSSSYSVHVADDEPAHPKGN